MLKTILKIMAILIIILIVVIGSGLFYVSNFLPDVGSPQDIKVEITPERTKRGEYLANHVVMCIDCHSTRDWQQFSGPMVANTEGMGGEVFSRDVGMPGNYYASNITPSGIGDWTDGELLRAITAGVNKKGKALFPIMPYPYFGKMDKEDIYSIIAYIRTLPSIENTVAESESDFPMNFIINLMPSEPDFQPNPSRSDKIAYGKVLSAVCVECHTQTEKGQIIPELAFSGGRPFRLFTKGTVFSSNITPDKETGIGKWTERKFIQTFKKYEDSSFVSSHIDTNNFNTVMPWVMLAGMHEDDLSAIYQYLMQLKPQQNNVVRFVPDE